MRETFDDVHALIMYYQFIKTDVLSIASILPKEDNGDSNRSLSAQLKQSSVEDKFVFICDVENFIKWYAKKSNHYVGIPNDRLLDIFHFSLCKGISKYKSWGHMAMSFDNHMKKGEVMPRRFKYRQHLRVVAENMRGSLEEYFMAKGMLNNVVSEYAVDR